MPRPKMHRVELTDKQVQRLHKLINKGHASARVIRRAHVLLLAAEDKEDKDVAAALQLNAQTVYQLRRRFALEGLEATLYDKPRLGSKPMLDGKQEALLVALACSQPDERESWTMQLLADKLVELKVVDRISDETVRRTLKKTSLNRGRRSSGASPR
jgi:putative transposase